MKKRHFLLLLSSLIIASFTLACTPKTPEDRIIKILDTIYDKVEKGKDCDKLAKDLNSYCKSVSDELAAASKELMPSDASAFDKATPAQEKVEKALEKFEGLEKSACADDEKVMQAANDCFNPMLPDMSKYD